MATSLRAIRQDVGRTLRECIVGTATAATATTLTDTANLLDSTESDQRFSGAWAYVAGATRRILGYTPASGTIAVDAWAAPGVGDEYEIHLKLRPDELNRLINTALVKLPHHDEQKIAVVANQRQYSLAAYAWLTGPGQVYAVCVEEGAAGEYTHREIGFEVTDDAGVLTLHVDPCRTNGYDNLVLRCTRHYEALDNDAATTACPLEWIRSAALYHAYEWLARNVPETDTERYEREMARAGAALMAINQHYFNPPARRQRSPYTLGS
jgi:hypothetical protein